MASHQGCVRAEASLPAQRSRRTHRRRASGASSILCSSLPVGTTVTGGPSPSTSTSCTDAPSTTAKLRAKRPGVDSAWGVASRASRRAYSLGTPAERRDASDSAADAVASAGAAAVAGGSEKGLQPWGREHEGVGGGGWGARGIVSV